MPVLFANPSPSRFRHISSGKIAQFRFNSSLERIIDMKRNTSTFFSMGVSAVLIAVGVWFLYNHSIGFRPGYGRWAMGQHGMMGGGMMGGGMGIVMIIFWIVLIAAVVLLFSGAINGLRGTKQNREDASNPLEILKQRYARGEIDKVEYEGKRQDLLL